MREGKGLLEQPEIEMQFGRRARKGGRRSRRGGVRGRARGSEGWRSGSEGDPEAGTRGVERETGKGN